MQQIVVRGFVFIGAGSTVAWVVTIFTAKHHRPIWELLSFGLAPFLLSALMEVRSLRRGNAEMADRHKQQVAQLKGALDRESRRDDLLAVLDRLTRECQGFEGTMSDFTQWLDRGEDEIATYSLTLATEWAQRHQREVVGPLLMAVPIRLEKLKDIRRAVMSPGSHLGRGTQDA